MGLNRVLGLNKVLEIKLSVPELNRVLGIEYTVGDSIECSFIECCVDCCVLQIFHVSASFQLLSLFVRIVWSQSSL